MTTTRPSFVHRHSPPPKLAWNASPSCVRTVERGHRRRQLRNVRGDRCVGEMTHGTAIEGVGNGAWIHTGRTRAKVDGSRRRGDATSTMRENGAIARALRAACRGVTRRARRSAADTARARLRMTSRRISGDGPGDDDALRDRGAGVPMEITSEVLMAAATLPPSGIVHIPPVTRSMPHGGIDGGGAPGVPVQVVLLMRIPARGTNDAHIARTTRADAAADHFRLHLIRHLAPRHCQRGWVLVLGIGHLARGPPVNFRRNTTALTTSRDASLSCGANSKGREGHRLKSHPGVRAHVLAPPSWTLRPFRTMPPPNRRTLLRPVRVRHRGHHHPSPRRQTFPLIAFDRTCRPRWTNTSNRRMTLGWTSHRWLRPAFRRRGSSTMPSLKAGMRCSS